ncbi:hypothetical protein ACHQM5_001884 [Ranunculus cassubicifolius]
MSHQTRALSSSNTSLDRQDPVVDNKSGPLNFTEAFTTDIIFASRDELVKWVKQKGREVGMVIVIRRSDCYKESGRKPRLVLACQLHGKDKRSKIEGFNCPFLLKGEYLVGTRDKWLLKVLCGHHNHTLPGTELVPQETLWSSVGKKKKIVDKKVICGHHNHTLWGTKLVPRETSEGVVVKKQKVVDKMIQNYWKLVPGFFVPYVKKIVEVDRDGNCGFRAIAKGIWSDDSKWGEVRRGCLEELNEFEGLYVKMFGGKTAIKELRQRLDCFTSPCRRKNWFLMPEMGFLAASKFDVVVVSISGSDVSSVLPLHSLAPIGDVRVFGIQFVDDNHNVFVDLDEKGPLPRPMSLWGKRKYDCALSWETRILSRMEAYDRINTMKVEESSSIELVE